jgi:hypothetical protein
VRSRQVSSSGAKVQKCESFYVELKHRPFVNIYERGSRETSFFGAKSSFNGNDNLELRAAPLRTEHLHYVLV